MRINRFFPRFPLQQKIKRKSIADVDDFSFQNDSVTPQSRNKEFIGSSFPKRNLFFFLLFVLFLLASLEVRAFYLQIIKGNYYLRLAEGNRTRLEIIHSQRGVIYDRHGKQLVFNVPHFFLTITPQNFFFHSENFIHLDCGRQPALCRQKGLKIIQNIFQEKKIALPKQVEKNYQKISSLNNQQNIILADNLSYPDAMALWEKIQKVPGLQIEITNARHYLPIKSMCHWLGYIGRISPQEYQKYKSKGYLLNDYIGKTGLEKYYESLLRGKNGYIKIEVNALGEEKGILSKTPPQDGKSLMISIDSRLQKEAEKVLAEHLKKDKKKKGVVIALNPQNGEVLAMVSLPDYSLNDFTYKIDPKVYQKLLQNPDHPLFNRAIMGEYPSGSIIKIVMAAAALQEKIITPFTTILSTGGIRVGKWFFPDWKKGGHGITNVRKAIADSVNTFFYMVGGGYKKFKGLGLKRILKYDRLFGLGAKTGIDLPGEKPGFLPTKKWKEKTQGQPWYIGDTYHLSIGQGALLITPLQAAVFTSIIANGGTFYRPHFLIKVLNDKKEVLKTISPQIVRKNFVSAKNLAVVARGMKDCVSYGSCRWLKDLPVSAAGKTGTAQHGKGEPPHAWFVAFAPFKKPKIVIVVLVENGGEGYKTSEPIANEILKWYFTNDLKIASSTATTTLDTK